jgi:hypothetical protein
MSTKTYKEKRIGINQSGQMQKLDEYVPLFWQFHDEITDIFPTDSSFILDNSDPTSALFMNVDRNCGPSLDMSGVLDDWEENGHILLKGVSEANNAILYRITGAITRIDAGSGKFYYRIPIIISASEFLINILVNEEIGFTYFAPPSGGSGMEASTYDPAAIEEQLVGLAATQTLTNKTINGVVLNDGGLSSSFLNETGTYSIPTGYGWLGSQTRIKIAPWDVVSYNDKDGVSIQDDGGTVNDAAGKITEMITGVFIPTGYKATAFMVYASANISVELYENQIDDTAAVSKGSGNANTEVPITDVDSTTTNYLSIIIVETGNDITGGYVIIETL